MKNLGYTLIELVIVIAISAVLLLTAVSLFFTTFQGGGKTAAAEYSKQAGVRAMDQITYYLRNAKKLVPNDTGTICGANMASVAVQNLNGTTTVFSSQKNGTKSGVQIYGVAIGTAVPITAATTSFLTPNDVSVTNGTFRVDCTPVTYGQATWDGSPPRVTVSFTLQKGLTSIDKSRDIVTLPFTSSVTLRNY